MQDILPEELKKRLQKEENINLIDVRDPWEHEEQNIGGENIPLSDLASRIQSLNHLKEKEVILYCRSGVRSEGAKAFFEENGFLQVKNLIGGIESYFGA